MSNLTLNDSVSFEGFDNSSNYYSFYKNEIVKENTHILYNGKDVIDEDGILKDKFVIFANRNDVLVENELYKVNIYKKDIASCCFSLTEVYHNGKLRQVDRSYKRSFFDDTLKLHGIGKPVKISELEPKEIYFIHYYSSSIIKPDRVMQCRVIDSLTVSRNYWKDATIRFDVEYNYNNQHIDYIRFDADKFIKEYLTSNYYSKGFIEHINKNVVQQFAEEETTIGKIILDKYNWEENQEYEQYEGYHLKSITLKPKALERLNTEIKRIFDSYAGKKHTIDYLKMKLHKLLDK